MYLSAAPARLSVRHDTARFSVRHDTLLPSVLLINIETKKKKTQTNTFSVRSIC